MVQEKLCNNNFWVANNSLRSAERQVLYSPYFPQWPKTIFIFHCRLGNNKRKTKSSQINIIKSKQGYHCSHSKQLVIILFLNKTWMISFYILKLFWQPEDDVWCLVCCSKFWWIENNKRFQRCLKIKTIAQHYVLNQYDSSKLSLSLAQFSNWLLNRADQEQTNEHSIWLFFSSKNYVTFNLYQICSFIIILRSCYTFGNIHVMKIKIFVKRGCMNI